MVDEGVRGSRGARAARAPARAPAASSAPATSGSAASTSDQRPARRAPPARPRPRPRPRPPSPVQPAGSTSAVTTASLMTSPPVRSRLARMRSTSTSRLVEQVGQALGRTGGQGRAPDRTGSHSACQGAGGPLVLLELGPSTIDGQHPFTWWAAETTRAAPGRVALVRHGRRAATEPSRGLRRPRCCIRRDDVGGHPSQAAGDDGQGRAPARPSGLGSCAHGQRGSGQPQPGGHAAPPPPDPGGTERAQRARRPAELDRQALGGAARRIVRASTRPTARSPP